jgi:glycosyltransferase involved in cell wall biosynthesis
VQLVLVTASYPFAGEMEQTFLEPELMVLSKRFDDIVIVPQTLNGDLLEVPGNPVIRTDLAARRASVAKLLPTFGPAIPLLFEEVRHAPSILAKPVAMKRLARFLTDAVATNGWVRKSVAVEGSIDRHAIFYTWWASGATMGLALAKAKVPEMVVVSRAHNADLYPEQHDPPYLPGRPAMFNGIDRLFPDSSRGVSFVRTTYPSIAERCFAARQGVNDPGFLSQPSADGVFRVVSCSLLIDRKRVDLLGRGLAAAAKRDPSQRIEWTHIGDGPRRADVESCLEAAEPSANFSGRIVGLLSPAELMEFYRTNPVDLFANVSRSEGTPVSLMEAASCGIPILATAVGGNTEVVTPDVGALLPEDPSVEQVADALLGMIDSTEELSRRRLAIRRRWEGLYDATDNYKRFADDLIALRSSTLG